TSVTFTGVPGHRYASYTVATDHVGHAEQPPPEPDAVIFITPTTTVALASSLPEGSVYGQVVVVTATGSSLSGATPTGFVQFVADGLTAGDPLPLTGGAASLSRNHLAAGTHTVQAQYLSNAAAFHDAQSDPLSQLVSKAPLVV